MNDTKEIYLDKNESPTKIKIELKKDPMSARLTYNERTIEFYVKSFENQFFVSKYQLTSLESIKAIYRNLRENYEYRLRYDEAGEFFIREMELKRNYHQASRKNLKRTELLKRRFSITGLYYSLFRYGERLLRPSLAVVIPFLGLSILLTSIVHNATLIDAARISFSDMLQIELQKPLEPLLSDAIIRILSLGILGMYLIPLRRKFERKFRH